jgi:dTDP-glucose 4,6-dehydratase
VTGGAGFIGSNFVRRVLDGTLEKISTLKVLDKLTYAGSLTNFSSKERAKFEFVEGDVCNPEVVDRSLKNIDVVINFAAESHVDRSISSSRQFFLSNTLGVQTLLDSSRKVGISTFVQVSTDEVYGSISVGSWPETDPLKPNSPYAASKAAAELICQSYSKTYAMDIRVTRCSNNYGPFQYPEKVIPLFVTNLIDGYQIPLYGDGKNVRDWLHVDDHCLAINKVLIGGKAGETYNIGGGMELTNEQLTFQVLSLMNYGTEKIKFVQDRLGHDIRYSVDASKIKRELGFEPQVDWETGLASTVEWYRANELWWRPLKN